MASELEAVDDERLGLLTVVAVEVDRDIQHATIFWSRLEDDLTDDEVNALLEEHRAHLQSVVNRQTRLRRTPILKFTADEVTRHAARIDEIIRGFDHRDDED